MRAWTIVAAVSLILAGCAAPTEPISDAPDPLPDVLPDLPDILEVNATQLMEFSEKTVTAAIKFSNDLYEPTMEVSDTGAIYVTGHTILVDTTGAPAYVSHDDGETWQQMAFASTAQMPAGIHGATPPPSDEIFIVAGDDGYAYGVDITAATFPVNAWSNDGLEHIYHNPNAYDRVESSTSCQPVSLNDRPWAAYGDGKLFMVNNPGGGALQIGVMDVPMALPAGAPGNPLMGPEWNTCASTGGWIPGIPDMRDDHFFAAPQATGPVWGTLFVVLGNANDIHDLKQVTVMEYSNTGGGTSNYGQANFDANGDLFVAIRANQDINGTETGFIKVATSQNDGENFTIRDLQMTAPVRSMFMDGNMAGPGALLTWGQVGADGGTDWYAGHLRIAHDGGAVLENVSLALAQGPYPSAHVQGAAAGPDGRAYLVMDYGGGPGSNPLTIVRQDAGPALPIEVVAEALADE